MAIGSAPFTGCSVPSRLSSPTIMNLPSCEPSMSPAAARMPIASGRSKLLPSFAQSGWRHVDCNVSHRKLITVILHCSRYAVAALTHGLIAETGEMIHDAAAQANLYRDSGHLKAVDGRAICLY